MKTFIFGRPHVAALLFAISLGSCGKSPTATNSQAALNGPTAVDYSRRVGVAVRTGARTCVAVKDETLQAGSLVTLILPASPQRFTSAQISKTNVDHCPVTRETMPGVASYELSVPPEADFPKLTPLITVVGSPESNGFVMDNLNVQADLDQAHNKNTFRACGSDDGVHLTLWRGVPLTGTRLWTGYYYETGAAPGNLPTCSLGETALN